MSEKAASAFQKLGRIALIGYGNMGVALARGLKKNFGALEDPHEAGVTGLNLIVCERLPISCDFPFYHPGNVSELLSAPSWGPNDTIILCIKPQNLRDAAKTWRSVFFRQDNKGNEPLVISILAGTPTTMVQEIFSDTAPLVRAMPNIAATVDCSATALAASENTSAQFAQRAKDIFDTVGKSWIVPEELLDAVTGLSGSGPAYIYMIIEALSDGGVKMGMPRQLALDLAAQTVLGAAKLVQVTNTHPAVLRDQVTTPGGTTICAIHELEKHGLRPMLISAVVTATRRSARLAKIVQKKRDEEK